MGRTQPWQLRRIWRITKKIEALKEQLKTSIGGHGGVDGVNKWLEENDPIHGKLGQDSRGWEWLPEELRPVKDNEKNRLEDFFGPALAG